MMAAVAPGRITLYLRDDKSEYGTVVTNIATLNEVYCSYCSYCPYCSLLFSLSSGGPRHAEVG